MNRWVVCDGDTIRHGPETHTPDTPDTPHGGPDPRADSGDVGHVEDVFRPDDESFPSPDGWGGEDSRGVPPWKL